MSQPWCLLVELAGEHADHVGVLDRLAGATRAEGGQVWGWAPAGQVAGLEPGTVAGGLLLALWPDRMSLETAVANRLWPQVRGALPADPGPVFLAAEALPPVGLPELPEIPTVASVPRPPTVKGNVLLIIRGSAWDQARLNRYRDIILPMHKEHRGYYEVFAVNPGQVIALAGAWTDQIFAVSRWPSRDAAASFWYSERYQTQAIPVRLGAGRFTVHQLDATP